MFSRFSALCYCKAVQDHVRCAQGGCCVRLCRLTHCFPHGQLERGLGAAQPVSPPVHGAQCAAWTATRSRTRQTQTPVTHALVSPPAPPGVPYTTPHQIGNALPACPTSSYLLSPLNAHAMSDFRGQLYETSSTRCEMITTHNSEDLTPLPLPLPDPDPLERTGSALAL